jgi:hypothetical protein
MTKGVKELSAQLQVRTQSPVKEKKQQGDKSNYKEVFQIALSTIRTYRGRLSTVRRRPLVILWESNSLRRVYPHWERRASRLFAVGETGRYRGVEKPS